MPLPFITIVMPVRNEAAFIEHTLRQLLAQDYDPDRFEILVVDGQSTDGTPDRVAAIARALGAGHHALGAGLPTSPQRNPNPHSQPPTPHFQLPTPIRLLDNPRRLSSAARNIGIRASQGELILIVDGHCEIPSSRMLASLAHAFESSGADCVGRPQPLEVSQASSLQRAIAAARTSFSRTFRFGPVCDVVAGQDESFRTRVALSRLW